MNKKSVLQYIPVTLISICLTAGLASAQTTAFSYQGRLNAGGNPAAGSYEMRFELFDAVAGGVRVGPTVTDSSVAVANGIFTSTLDFGAPAFDGSARYLEVAVRPANDPNPFTILSPRQPIISVPYAIRASDAAQLGGIDASEYISTTNGPTNFIQNTTALQAGANFNIEGNGTAGSLNANGAVSLAGSLPPAPAAGQAQMYFDGASNKMKISENSGAFVDLVGAGGVSGSGTTDSIPVWSAGTTLANSLISQSSTTVQLPGFVSLAATASGNNVAFGSPNSETGMTISGPTGRADVRFDGTTLRLLSGPPASGPPSNGIAITPTGVQLPNGVSLAPTASGNAVAFGSPNSETGMTISGASGRADVRFSGSTLKLFASSGGIPSNGISIVGSTGDVAIGTNTGNLTLGSYSGNVAKLMVAGGSNYGVSAYNSSSVNDAVRGINLSSGIGVSGSSNGGIGVYAQSSGTALYVDGNARQSRSDGGLLKAMALIHVVHTGSNATSTASVVRCYNSINNSSSGSCGIGFGTVYGIAGVDINFGFQVTDRFISITGNSQYGSGTVTGYTNSTTVEVLDGGGTDEFFIFVY
jgi:hypothetical protein